MTSVTILGSGAVGALLGAALTEAGTETLVVTRDATAALIERDGVRVSRPGLPDHRVAVRAAPRSGGAPDALLIAVKAPQLAAALERVDGVPAVVVPLLNGVEHVAVLRERFGPDRVVAGVVRVQAHRDGPGHVVHRSNGVGVDVAAPGAPALEAALSRAGVIVSSGGTEAEVLWAKLSRLAGLALATAAADAPLGRVRADAEAVAREVVAVANAEGAGIPPDRPLRELAGLGAGASSSLRADVAAGAPDHELDAIGGAVLRAAGRHGLPVPVTAALVDRVAARAAGKL